MEDVGIEPTSSVLQTDAMTTSANPPNVAVTLCVTSRTLHTLHFAQLPRGGFEPAVAGLKGQHPVPLDERGVSAVLFCSRLSTLDSRLTKRLVKELNLSSSTFPFSDCGFAGHRKDHKPCVPRSHWHEWDSNPHSPRFKLGRYSDSRIVPLLS